MSLEARERLFLFRHPPQHVYRTEVAAEADFCDIRFRVEGGSQEHPIFSFWQETARHYNPAINETIGIIQATLGSLFGPMTALRVRGDTADCLIESLVGLGLDLNGRSLLQTRYDLLALLARRPDLPPSIYPEEARIFISELIDRFVPADSPGGPISARVDGSIEDSWPGAPIWFISFLSKVLDIELYSIECYTDQYDIYLDGPQQPVGGLQISLTQFLMELKQSKSFPPVLLVTDTDGEYLRRPGQMGGAATRGRMPTAHASPLCRESDILRLIERQDRTFAFEAPAAARLSERRSVPGTPQMIGMPYSCFFAGENPFPFPSFWTDFFKKNVQVTERFVSPYPSRPRDAPPRARLARRRAAATDDLADLLF